MLKWISTAPSVASKADQTPSTIRVTTDNPLASFIAQSTSDHQKATHNRLGLRIGSRRHHDAPEEIYSVTRLNPLFEDLSSMPSTDPIHHPWESVHKKDSRDELNRSPSSSGYESSVGTQHPPNRMRSQQQRQLPHLQPRLVELSPANDYRRQFVLGAPRESDHSGRTADDGVISIPRPSQQEVKMKIGQANVVRQNSQYVTRIQMPDLMGTDPGPESYDSHYASNHNKAALASATVRLPEPVWPETEPVEDVSNRRAPAISDTSDTTAAALVEQNEKYVTKILIAPRSIHKSEMAPPSPDPFDSIVTDSLLVWTSYDDEPKRKVVEDPKGRDQQEDVMSMNRTAELAVIRELSQTFSNSRTVETVSRALSHKTSSSGSTSDSTYGTIPQPLSNFGPSIAKRISMMKERWEQNSKRRLLVNDASDEDDPVAAAVRDNNRLDHRYIPRNGDLNFIALPSRHAGAPPAFSWAHSQHQELGERANPSSRLEVFPSRGQYLEPDQLSNSSSRSSGSRRVTFSADTVDNENSAKSCGSSSSDSSVPSSSTSPELKLNPQYLTQQQQRYIDPTNKSRLAGYYACNLQIHSEIPSYSNHSVKGSASGQRTVWESYHSPSSRQHPVDNVAGRPHGNLQLHPNYGAALQDRTVCVDFTLDGGDVSLLERRSVNNKLRRRLCCCVLLLLCLAVLVVVVIGISLYLTHGQKVFGSI